MIKSGEVSHPVGVAMDNKMMPSQRRRKKVVTFASLSQLAEIRALATCESHSQSSSDSEAESVAETALPALPKPSLYLKMPLEDRDATCGNVSRISCIAYAGSQEVSHGVIYEI